MMQRTTPSSKLRPSRRKGIAPSSKLHPSRREGIVSSGKLRHFCANQDGFFKTLFAQKCGVALDFPWTGNRAAVARGHDALAATPHAFAKLRPLAATPRALEAAPRPLAATLEAA